MRTLEDLRFTNSFASLPEAFYIRLRPTPLEQARLVSYSPAAAALLDLAPGEMDRIEFSRWLSGAEPPLGADPLAALYVGHQFGQYVPQLGDGRARSAARPREDGK
ncbi:MAG: protein adenylyltransferase SelO family protein [Chromatiaceae bacterium]